VETETVCDCGKRTGSSLSTSCLHLLVVSDPLFSFPSPISEGEDPHCVVLNVDSDSMVFSVASASGAKRHHSNKRLLVTFTTAKGWKCPSSSCHPREG